MQQKSMVLYSQFLAMQVKKEFHLMQRVKKELD